ncbi:signal transduction histidine kinase [Thermocatellispora tengchongensis]|uniref:histidine kinase n=1 Tax=Thermocatellispora tengchongensis TaxID=1073253 RepID=A0A840P315_9ACTN|nr:histidine kinase [Thermocatellispora tengchongensis]MBB5130435.1 signal transduction histidine kinase [Thermocatellispora tengchongensis]
MRRYARRYTVAVGRAAMLSWLAVAGAAQAAVSVVFLIVSFGLGLFFLFPGLARVTRWNARAARRRAYAWSGVRIDEPYLPPPPPPVPGPDGLYRHDRTLYKSPRVPAWNDRWRWVFSDPATWRDLVWRFADPFVAAALGAVPLLVLLGALAAPWYWRWPWGPAPLAAAVTALLGLMVAGAVLAALPSLLRAHSLWSRVLLAPTRRSQLTGTMRRITRARTDAAYFQAAELRRIERDLHDGAQARLVAMGMTLSAAKELAATDPAAARKLLSGAREESAVALAELRRVVRGIHPPVLAERGLGDAVRALALDSPLDVQVEADLEVRAGAPFESAAYFAVSELLTHLATRPGVERVLIDISNEGAKLRLTVTDDGDRAYDAAESLVAGIERRLAVFDGVLAVTATAHGPSTATIELPHALAGSIADTGPRMPLWKLSVVAAGHSVGWLPLFPQGLVAAIIKIIDAEEKPAWFLGLHVPEPYQWPTILTMIAVGLFMLGAAIVLPIAHGGPGSGDDGSGRSWSGRGC